MGSKGGEWGGEHHNKCAGERLSREIGDGKQEKKETTVQGKGTLRTNNFVDLTKTARSQPTLRRISLKAR